MISFSRRFSLSQRGTGILFLLLGGIFILVSLALVIYFAYDFFQLQSYVEGRCTITAKQLLKQQQEQTETYTSNGTTHTRTTTKITYAPDFQFTVQTTDGHSYATHGYDVLQTSSEDRNSQQAIVDQYTVGETYSCWYDPEHPPHAVLTRQFDWFVFIIPAVFLLVGGLFVLFGLLGSFGRTFHRHFAIRSDQ